MIDTSPAALRKLAADAEDEGYFGVGDLLRAIAAEKEAQHTAFDFYGVPSAPLGTHYIRRSPQEQHHTEQPLNMVAAADVQLPEHTISGPAGTGTYFNGHTDAALLAHREAYAKAAVAAEREQCAQAAQEYLTRMRSPFGMAVADAIRAAKKGTV